MDKYINQINGNIEQPKLTRKQISPEKILQLVLQVTDSSQEELYKSKNHNLCRQLACYTLRKHTQLTLNEIGTHLKMSYNSVSNTTRLFERKLKTEKKYSEVLNELQKLL
jgi:chromosomal replication initiation ATPase DnaA